MLDCARAQNLKISLSSLDFWEEFKITLTNVFDENPGQLRDPSYEYIFKPFVELITILILQSKRSQIE
jgi:hypothetical protein